jgi:hypothetical protein
MVYFGKFPLSILNFALCLVVVKLKNGENLMGNSMLMDTLFWAVKAPHHLLAALLCVHTHMSRQI